MMWLGRVDLRVIETREDGTQVFERQQLAGAVALRALMNDAARDKWSQVDDTITAFVGEHDDMTPPEVDALLADLNVAALDWSALSSVAGTESWGRSLLSTQLASWSELRHDTLLYAKPSYSGGTSCEFPTAYVDPYPEFFSALADFAAKGETLVRGLPDGDAAAGYFQRLGSTAATLRDMAQDQRQGLPLSQEHLAFVNRAVHIQPGCGTPFADGWYTDLFANPDAAIEADPTIADVHTQPTDENGNDVGRVLHVAAGAPHLMVVTADGCSGSHAYVGLASSYYERITEQYQRMTDQDWAAELQSNPPAPPAWLPKAFTP